MSRSGSHPRRQALLRRPPPSQALKNAPLAAFFTYAISAPLAPLHVRGAKARKTLQPTREQHRHLDRELFRGVFASPWSPEVFRASVPPSGGMRRRPGNERRPKAALLSACEAQVSAAEGAADPFTRGCKRGPDTGAPGKLQEDARRRPSTREKKYVLNRC